MKTAVRFPIRLKVMASLLFCVTAVVSVITFTMAGFFHDDKRSYMNDWVSIAALGVADECRSLLGGYIEKLRLASRVMLDEGIARDAKAELLQSAFDTFPALVEVAVYRDGELLDLANDERALAAAGLSQDELHRRRAEEPLPLDAIVSGRVHLVNSTLSGKMPSLSVAFPGDGEGVVVAALLRQDELQRLGTRFKVFEVLIAASDGTLLAHPDPRRVSRREPAGLEPEAASVHDANRAGLTLEAVRAGVEVLGGFAGVDPGGLTVAAYLPRSAAYLASRELLTRLLMLACALLLVMAVVGRLLARHITRPLERLSRATRTIAKGRFDIRVDAASRDEIGALAGSFNQMASELQAREQALGEAHRQLIQSEKLAAFGQLGAGIAHEVKNPLAGILGCAQLSLMEIPEGTRLHENVRIIERETSRCKTIIDNLLKFARQEKAVQQPTPVNDVVRDAVAIVNHQLELNQVKVRTELASDLPEVRGNANQLQQVLMNLMINAQQAMQGTPGTVTLSTRRVEPDQIQIAVADTGPGIPAEIRSKLFEPFFTTKPTGEGTGLGLSVSFGIIKDHGGDIVVHSDAGHGATFLIQLPVLQEGAAPSDRHP
jgi:signal transduction histidine kinase